MGPRPVGRGTSLAPSHLVAAPAAGADRGFSKEPHLSRRTPSGASLPVALALGVGLLVAVFWLPGAAAPDPDVPAIRGGGTHGPRPAVAWPAASAGGERLGEEAAPDVAIAPGEQVRTFLLAAGGRLEGVLGAAGVQGRDAANLTLALREYRNPRGLAEGTEITARRVDGRIASVEVRLARDTILHLAPDPLLGWRGEVRHVPVRVDTIQAGILVSERGSMLEDLLEAVDAGFPIEDRVPIISGLAGIFGYRVDLVHDVEPEDGFRVVYEREVRPDGSVRRRRILAAEITTAGRAHTAALFDTGHGLDYYDAEGRSLRSVFRRYPLDFVRITSNFSWRRYHPVSGIYRAHVGTDFGAPPGTPVLATADGIVDHAGMRGGYGNLIILEHAGGYATRYAHLSGVARNVRRGARVKQGEVIGYVGSTGIATGPHLHYELRRNGHPVDPRTVDLPTGIAIPDQMRESFGNAHAARLALLPDRTSRHAATRTAVDPVAGH